MTEVRQVDAPMRDYSPFWWFVSSRFSRLVCTVWNRLSVQGQHHVPKQGAVILAPNHASYLDPMIVGSTPGRYVRFLAQRGLAGFGPMRWWLKKVGVRLIDRNAPSKEIMRMLIRELKAGQCVTVFPEGTRSRDGSIAEFRSGLEFLVRRTGAPVVPVGVSGSYKAFGRGARFVWPSKCAVAFGEPWPAEKVLADGGIESLRREVSRLAGLPLQEPVATAESGARGAAVGAAMPTSAVGSMQSNNNGGGA